MPRIIKLVKKFILSVFFIYGYNMLAQPLGIIIPLNIFTILYVMMFGVLGLVSLIIIFICSF